jgi:hypothetical protein
VEEKFVENHGESRISNASENLFGIDEIYSDIVGLSILLYSENSDLT